MKKMRECKILRIILNNDDDDMDAILRRFHARSAPVVSDDEDRHTKTEETADGNLRTSQQEEEEEEDNESLSDAPLSKRKMRERNRLTVAQLKILVERADLVEAHDVASSDPLFLLKMKAVRGAVAVPRHWGRKRKYLQGKRGIEKAPFQLPDFITKTGISEVRSAVAEDEGNQTTKSKNRSRVAPKMGALDVDYRTLHDAFFKHQNKLALKAKLTKFGDLYYEGKEFEMQTASSDRMIGGPISDELKDALGMTGEHCPPPWLVNMQKHGPPPSYPNLKIPGLNAPLPSQGCSYGYHVNGWGKPPVDAFGRPLYGGNPFDPPGSGGQTSTADWDFDASSGAIVTSDGKTIGRKPWGVLPMGKLEEDDGSESDDGSDDDEESSSSGEEMAESDDEEEGEETEGAPTAAEQQHAVTDGTTSVVPPGSAVDLRKGVGGEGGTETPAIIKQKQLYEVLQQTKADGQQQAGAVFKSDVAYVVPNAEGTSAEGAGGAESVLSKTPFRGSDAEKRKRSGEEGKDNEGDLGKRFKF